MGAKLEITQEKLDQLEAVMNANMQKPGPLMPTLHEAQKIFGCVPIPIQKIISKKLGVSVAEINGVVTFYAQFSIEPKGKHIVGVCLGTACYVKGAQAVCDKFSELLGIKPGKTTKDGLFTLDALRCIGTCGVAPAVSINGKVYPKVSVSAVKDIVAEYKAKEN